MEFLDYQEMKKGLSKMAGDDEEVEIVLDALDDLGLATQWAERPHMAAWYAHIKARPAYATAFYPGARLSELFGEAA